MDLFETLRALDRDWLARQLAELAAGDPVLSARLVEAAAGVGRAAVTDLWAEFAAELGGLAEEARDHYDEWYPDTGDLEELLDEAEVLLDEAPAAVRELADYVPGTRAVVPGHQRFQEQQPVGDGQHVRSRQLPGAAQRGEPVGLGPGTGQEPRR